MGFFVLIGGASLIIGLFHLFAKDYLWYFTYFALKLQGIEAERTAWWYMRMNIQGVLGVVIGGLLVYVGLTSK